MKKLLTTISIITLSLSLLLTPILISPTLASESNTIPNSPNFQTTSQQSLSYTKTIKPTKVTLNKKTTSIPINSTEQLIPTISPLNATNQNVTWKSSSTKIATVDSEGNIKGVKKGKATITVKTADNRKTAKCIVTVTDIPQIVNVTGITLNKINTTIDMESNEQLIATISPLNTTNKDITWESSNSEIVKIDKNGILKGLKIGKTIIMATTVDGNKTASCEVIVDDQIINFNDKILSMFIIWSIPNKPNNSEIYKSEVNKIKIFQISKSGIKDLTGIESLTNLAYLNLNWSPLENISQLTQLTNLTTLKLYNNKISDLSPLEGLINLEYLWLSDNKISDVSVLKGLTKLKILDLRYNLISEGDKEELKKSLPNCFIYF